MTHETMRIGFKVNTFAFIQQQKSIIINYNRRESFFVLIYNKILFTKSNRVFVLFGNLKSSLYFLHHSAFAPNQKPNEGCCWPKKGLTWDGEKLMTVVNRKMCKKSQ